MENNIKEIKQFNRFYVRVMGLLSLYNDQNPYSATEAMILFQIQATTDCTASFLSDYYLFDKGYISRILKKFVNKGLIKKVPSAIDRRSQHLLITEKGEDELHALEKNADKSVEKMIAGILEDDLDKVIKSMKQIEEVLKKNDH
ncbi:MarR family winged helix-turn-helix transcriptional regulator [Lentibacillus sediminis]|uniref:MarR family winged helix-turn-helix transcriptional regulator n=1 Tax=Lentibacillus sediminis TaxID=1940529 RepID=UPI000C1C7184|nr:MarR family winged helix-turn-helix transcriptional regulator [Lentibacillus sediminis]